MIRVEPFRPEHIFDIEVQPMQAGDDYRSSLYELGMMQAARGPAFTARDAETDRILLCGGAAEFHAEYATLWAVLSLNKGRNMQTVTRRVAAFIAGLHHTRVDATIHAGFPAAIRWARMIGLVHETTLAEAMPDGGDALIFRRKH